ncbi:hypothetical protein Tther_00762 [Tepidimonas thermarum]|uniref:DUF3782 domain-containing protein n=1 Tax=Tepidimonas thermarum TaxID=335431 RepID=A0A554X4U5_9BURK|nr:DUF3782 domain-containing protein [Tepidimonas thermarum]TSE30859.1 hypothetical protein Tther_00762 [Tepidimonas thermarum]
MTTAADISWDDLKAMILGLAEQGKETDRRMQETDRRMQETDRLIRDLRESGKETDRRIRALERQLGRLGNRLGQFVQDMVEPAVVRLFQERGIPVHRVMPNVRARNDAGQTTMEIDLLVINGDHAIAVECKSRLTTDDVDEHLDRLGRLKAAFPEYADKQLHGAVAAMGAPDEVVRYADKQGLYVLVQADDDVVLRNQPGFEPRTW